MPAPGPRHARPDRASSLVISSEAEKSQFYSMADMMYKNKKLYKYLDVNGAIMMLHYSNLQFTNATCLNDPFDCHPGLIDFSNVPDEVAGAWGKEIIASVKSNRHENLRFHTWLCSLSKVNDSILMWSYYGNHKGVCVGIDMEKAYRYLDNIPCALTFGATELEVQYREIIDKPDYFHNSEDYYHYQLSTKAKEWEHEKEVRLVLDRPSPTVMALTYEPKDNEVDSSGLNVPPVSLSNVPGTAESIVPLIAETNVPGVSL